MDIAEILKLVLSLFSNNQESTKQSTNEQQNNIQAQNDLNSSFWQLPDYDKQQFQQQNQNSNKKIQNDKPNSNLLDFLSSIDINALAKLISTVSQFFKSTKQKKEPSLKETEPSFISNLHKIDNF